MRREMAGSVEAGQQEREKAILDKAELLLLSPQEITDRFKQAETQGNLDELIRSVVADDEVLALVSWWERWLPKNQSKLMEQAVAERRKNEQGHEDQLPLGLEKKFSSEELDVVFENLGALQLNFGCSQGCKYCAFDALPGVKETMAFGLVKNLLEKYGDKLPKGLYGGNEFKTFFYYASDPADYVSEYNGEVKTYKDVHDLATQHTGKEPFVSTREVLDEKWIDYMKGLRGEKRVSTLGLPDGRVHDLRKKMGQIVRKPDVVRGVGRDVTKDRSQIGGGGIGCFDGTFLTPRGLYNTVLVPVSEQFPQGMIIMPIEKLSDAKVAPGDNFIDALRYMVVSNEDVTNLTGTYKPGGYEEIYAGDTVEYRVYINGQRKFLLVDKSFNIQKIADTSFFEQDLLGLVENALPRLKDFDNVPISEDDLDKMYKSYWGYFHKSRYCGVLSSPLHEMAKEFKDLVKKLDKKIKQKKAAAPAINPTEERI